MDPSIVLAKLVAPSCEVCAAESPSLFFPPWLFKPVRQAEGVLPVVKRAQCVTTFQKGNGFGCGNMMCRTFTAVYSWDAFVLLFYRVQTQNCLQTQGEIMNMTKGF